MNLVKLFRNEKNKIKKDIKTFTANNEEHDEGSNFFKLCLTLSVATVLMNTQNIDVTNDVDDMFSDIELYEKDEDSFYSQHTLENGVIEPDYLDQDTEWEIVTTPVIEVKEEEKDELEKDVESFLNSKRNELINPNKNKVKNKPKLKLKP